MASFLQPLNNASPQLAPHLGHTTALDPAHGDMINDMSFDGSGRSLATCSSDQKVNVWSREEGSEEWVKTHSFQAHNGSVYKVKWAHPNFGRVLATCSFDRKACIFEEIPGDQSSPTATVWTKRYTFVDCHAPVTDVKFGPKSLGLVLALGSVDGTVRIYEAMSSFKLNMWLSHSVIKKMKNCHISSISWSSPTGLPVLLAVGANGGRDKTEKLSISGYTISPQRFGLFELSHEKAPPGGDGTGAHSNAKEYRWNQITDRAIDFKDPTRIHDVAFAPSVGRSFHMLAIATSDIIVVKISRVSPFQHGPSKYDFSQPETIHDSTGEMAWRLSWNFTGTVLGASCSQGKVKLFKQNYLNSWICISNLGSSSSHLEHPLSAPSYPRVTSSPVGSPNESELHSHAVPTLGRSASIKAFSPFSRTNPLSNETLQEERAKRIAATNRTSLQEGIGKML